VGACGTAAVISPIRRIADPVTGQEFHYCKDGKAGEISGKLYTRLLGIQYGDEPDKFGWITIVE